MSDHTTRLTTAVDGLDGAVGGADLDGRTLPFWVELTDEEDAELDDDTLGILSRRGDAVLRAVPLGPLRRNLAEAVDALQKVFADVAARDDALELAEAQLSFQVSAGGGVQLVGSGQVQATRGLTLTFRRA